ncbi:splicing factor [Cryptosporidium canis]|uniref:Splicing factor n=1 Tax=Cryptosporidium canis TaxID=195482 RepID=A0ABQ8PAA1_9CRYT|nr:splicing factor [Cryptosporidium canis]
MEGSDHQLRADNMRVSGRREYNRRGRDISGHPTAYRGRNGRHPYRNRRRDCYPRRDGSRSPERRYSRAAGARSSSVSPDLGSSHDGTNRAEVSGDSKLHRVKRDLEYSSRDDLTVLVMNLNPDALEYDVYEFFTAYAGDVRDIRIIRDNRTGRSKGICYVEFFSVEAVLKALKLSGQSIMDASITVQASQAEKNRAAKLAKLEEIKAETTPLLLRVDGLVGLLARITQDEVESLFSTFGKVTSVSMELDADTQRSLGSAQVLFEKAIEGLEAIQALNHFEIAGQKITVSVSQENGSSIKIPTHTPPLPFGSVAPSGVVTPSVDVSAERPSDAYPQGTSELDQLDESEETLLLGADSRNFLTKKLLARTQSKLDGTSIQDSTRSIDSLAIPNPPSPIATPVSTPSRQLSGAALEQSAPLSSKSTSIDNSYGNDASSVCSVQADTQCSCLLFGNMFTVQSIQESMEEGETLEQVLVEIREDAEEECKKHGTLLECFLDKEKNGNVWVRYSTPEEASKARTIFNGRFFGGRKLTVSFVRDEDFPRP